MINYILIKIYVFLLNVTKGKFWRLFEISHCCHSRYKIIDMRVDKTMVSVNPSSIQLKCKKCGGWCMDLKDRKEFYCLIN
jgi:hypothetical protein